MLSKIPAKPIEPPKLKFREKKSITVSGLKPSTYEFILEEAKARNMGPSEFLRNILELLESGDF